MLSEDLFNQAKRHLETMKAERKALLDALQAQLNAAVHDWQRAQIQKQIDQIHATYDGPMGMIARAEFSLVKLEAGFLVEKNARDATLAEQRAAEEAQVKESGLRAWTNAGGDPAVFEKNWPAIRETVMRERVIDRLINQPNPPSIRL
jgi:multidrug efflux pump subunit AcrA (membrane-fusion protein)